MTITNLSQRTLLASQAVLASTTIQRMQGLLGRKSLPSGEALIIANCQSIHMMFMKFPIDVIFIDKKGKVIGLCSNIQPFCFSPIFFKAYQAIELPSGTILQSKTALGDLLQIS